MIKDFKDRQQSVLEYHNKNKNEPKDYKVGEQIFVKENRRLGTKLSKNYKREIVKENRHATVLTESGRVVHKNNIRN
jgi:hypothetical protein